MSWYRVLILVVMEDALAQKASCPHAPKHGGCLNPCCNGRCTRTSLNLQVLKSLRSLNPCCNGRCTRTVNVVSLENYDRIVLILVVMEDALAHLLSNFQIKEVSGGLNPCCNGRCTRTVMNYLLSNFQIKS